MTTDVAARRIEIDTQIAALRAQRGVGLLDGTGFNKQAMITRLVNERSSLDDLEAEAVRRERVETAKELAKRRDGLRDEGQEVWHAFLAEARDAELAARTFFASTSDLLSDARRLCKIIASLGGNVPSQLGRFQLPRTIGGLFAALMVRLPEQSGRLGAVEWPGHSPYKADQDWVAYLTRRIGPGLMQTLKGKGNGRDDSNKK